MTRSFVSNNRMLDFFLKFGLSKSTSYRGIECSKNVPQKSGHFPMLGEFFQSPCIKLFIGIFNLESRWSRDRKLGHFIGFGSRQALAWVIHGGSLLFVHHMTSISLIIPLSHKVTNFDSQWRHNRPKVRTSGCRILIHLWLIVRARLPTGHKSFLTCSMQHAYTRRNL